MECFFLAFSLGKWVYMLLTTCGVRGGRCGWGDRPVHPIFSQPLVYPDAWPGLCILGRQVDRLVVEIWGWLQCGWIELFKTQLPSIVRIESRHLGHAIFGGHRQSCWNAIGWQREILIFIGFLGGVYILGFQIAYIIYIYLPLIRLSV